MTRAQRPPTGPLVGTLRSRPAPGGRYAQVLLDGDVEPVPAFLPAALALELAVDDRVLLDMVGRVPVVRCDAP